MLKMKRSCEQCQTSLKGQCEAFICSYECTFCKDCTIQLDYICPNCNGELVQRPKRQNTPWEIGIHRLKAGLGWQTKP